MVEENLRDFRTFGNGWKEQDLGGELQIVI
jgi:hypothetical protein